MSLLYRMLFYGWIEKDLIKQDVCSSKDLGFYR
jgi:hypothetical protein